MRLLVERNDAGRRSLVLRRGGDEDLIERVDAEPLEGTRMSLFNSVIPNFYAQNGLTPGGWFPGDGQLAERVWAANRCIQLNAQQIASMPLRFHNSDREPTWVSAPDPHWFPNGIGDALHAIVANLYGWGFALLYVTSFYETGFPQMWTVLDSCQATVEESNGARVYKLGEQTLDPARVVQIDRNPGTSVKGTSALRAYAQIAWGLLAAGNQAMTLSQGAIPQVYLKMLRKGDSDQAQTLQTDWMTATARRGGAPPVLPPDVDLEKLSFDPSDLALLDTQEFDAKAIMAAFGVPAVLMNMALQGGLTYQNPAALGEMWWRFELRPTATRIANALTAQMLPRGQWVSFDAADTFLPLDQMSDENDEQGSQVAKASPTQTSRPLTAIGGGG